MDGPLTVGEKYTIIRRKYFKKVSTAGKYLGSKFDDSHTFVAAAETYVFEDPMPFQSTGTTYYPCVKAASEVMV